jgi:hypothetical protein
MLSEHHKQKSCSQFIPSNINVHDTRAASPLTTEESTLSGTGSTIESYSFGELSSWRSDSSKGGRRQGTTTAAKKILLKTIRDATTKAATVFATHREYAHSNNKPVADGTLARIIQDVEAEYDFYPIFDCAQPSLTQQFYRCGTSKSISVGWN